jgi:hypothetical protein
MGCTAAFSLLAAVPEGTFRFALLACGYLPVNHDGAMAQLAARRPLSVPSLHMHGAQDNTIPNDSSRQMLPYFAEGAAEVCAHTWPSTSTPPAPHPTSRHTTALATPPPSWPPFTHLTCHMTYHDIPCHHMTSHGITSHTISRVAPKDGPPVSSTPHDVAPPSFTGVRAPGGTRRAARPRGDRAARRLPPALRHAGRGRVVEARRRGEAEARASIRCRREQRCSSSAQRGERGRARMEAGRASRVVARWLRVSLGSPKTDCGCVNKVSGERCDV